MPSVVSSLTFMANLIIDDTNQGTGLCAIAICFIGAGSAE